MGGALIAVDEDPLVQARYAQWVPGDPAKANDVSTAIKTMLLADLGSYANLQYILIVGGDPLIPFRRVPDGSQFREYDYVGRGHIRNDNATGAALYDNYFLSDDFYGNLSPTYWQGHDLYIPDYAVGRLVETPGEIAAFVDTFLGGQSTFAFTGLVAGYDFMIDASEVISDEMGAGGSASQQILIGDHWDSGDLSAAFLETGIDLASLNVHADHWGLGTPRDAGITSTQVVSATAGMERAVYYSMGCHAGLNIPDGDGNPHTVLDLPQAFLRRGVNWIGNTGYGIGGDGTPLSEQVMLYLSQELVDGTQQTVGGALVRAKQAYYTSLPRGQFGYDDEKVLGQVVLYGLPMYERQTMGGTSLAKRVGDPAGLLGEQSSVAVSAYAPQADCAERQGRTYYPSTEAVSTTIGTYYVVTNTNLDGGTHARLDEPVQPLLADEVGANVRGVVFEGGLYTAATTFDPVVARLANSDQPLGAEATLTDTTWRDAQIVSLSHLETVAGVRQRLVVLPGQYRGADGLQRVYDEVQVSLYTSTSDDWSAPAIQGVTHTFSGTLATVAVTATDTGGICRVVATYTDGGGTWQTVNLANTGGDTWQGELPLSGNPEYLIQVVDGAGNVAVDDNNGSYYHPYTVYLPVVFRMYDGP